MRADIIKVAPFNFISILDVYMSKGVNQHSTANVKGVIEDDAEYDYLVLPRLETTVEISSSDIFGNECVLFHGILDKLKVSTSNGLKIMELQLVSKSMLLDIETRVMAFQDTEMTYDELVKAVLSPHDDAHALINCGQGERLNQMFVQYHETDWTFLVRMASMHNDVLAVNDVLPGTLLYFGFQRRTISPAEQITPISYHIKKSIGRFIYKKENRVPNASESDEEQIIVRDRVIRNVGDPVEFLGRRLWVYKAESAMDGTELVHTYTLMNEAGIKVTQMRNYNIIGASLSGQVGAVAGTHVRMILDNAHSNNLDDIKWHLLSTVFSSPSGIGFYTPPAIGDTMRLYYPTEIEDAGYVVSAVHTSSTQPVMPTAQALISNNQDPTPDASLSIQGNDSDSSGSDMSHSLEEGREPSRKIFENNSGQRITLAQGFLSLSSMVEKADGSGNEFQSLSLTDGLGVVIVSSQYVSLSAEENVTLVSLEGNVLINAEEDAVISQKNSAVKLGGGVVKNTAP